MKEERFPIPPVGSTVTVCAVWPAPSGTPNAVQFNIYFREVVIPSNNWDKPNTFRLRTKAPEFLGDGAPKERVVSLDRVKTLVVNGKNVHRVTGDKEPANKKTVEMKRVVVKSSKGDKTYIVTVKGSRATCTCPGFGFRSKCRHITEVYGPSHS